MSTKSSNKSPKTLFLLAFLSLTAVTFGELFEQIVFVPNWLIGNIDENLVHFRAFKHTIDPGVFYFPLSLLFFISAIALYKHPTLSESKKGVLKQSIMLFGLVFIATIYVIVNINIPAIDKGLFIGEELASKMYLWAVLNCFRIILPMWAIILLSKHFILIKSDE